MCRKMLLWSIVIATIFAIFYFSAETAEISANRTYKITQSAVSEIEKLIKVERGSSSHIFHQLHYLIRKSAHFLEYMILAIFMTGALRVSHKGSFKLYTAIFSACLAIAGIDEGFQTFITGRSGSIKDVAIDGSGALIGTFAMSLTIRVVSKFILYNKKKIRFNLFSSNK